MKLVLLLIVCSLWAGTLLAQSPTFDVASIKPVPPGAQCGTTMIDPMPGGGITVDCLSLKTIVMWAYNVQNYQIQGATGWIESAGWNILAKPAASETPDSGPSDFSKMTDTERTQFMDLVRRRTQALLADRFQLILRHETTQQTVYTLTVAKGGPKVKESTDESGGSIRRGRGQIIGVGAKTEALAEYLAIDLLRPVTDQTGLTGRYDFKLQWTPDAAPGSDSAGTNAAQADNTGPSLFTAIQEQLGLRLEAQKGPVEVLIFDRAEKPSEN